MLRELQVTALLVTHDQEDAFAVADRVALMKRGRLLQVGKPEELYRNPASVDVASFIGRSVLVPARVVGDVASITLGGVTVTVRCAKGGEAADVGKLGADGWLAVLRPEALELSQRLNGSGWPGRIVSRRFAGSTFVYQVALDDGVEVEVSSPDDRVAERDEVSVGIASPALPVVPRPTLTLAEE
jgi:ABC-type Fe3+/spermidine/putrescine transport system ATPase subunit